MLVQFESGQHLYQSVIILSVWVWVGAAPISIGHLLVMTVQFLGPHLYRSIIFCVSLSFFGTAPILIGHCFISLCWVLFASGSRLHSWVLFDFESPSFRVFYVQSHFSLAVSLKVTVLGIRISTGVAYDLHGFALILVFPHLVTLCLSPIHHWSSRFPLPLHMT